MSKIEEDLADSIKRINFRFVNQEIKMECIKNYDGFSLLDERIGPFEKGKEYKLKLFKGITLIEKGVLQITTEEKCDNTIVQRHAIAERDNQKLVRQESLFFLNKIKEFKKFLKMDIKKGLRPPLDINKYDSYIMSILDHRLVKLLKLTNTELSLDDERRLTYSEQALFDKISQLIIIWRKFYLN